jgi:putative DNA primase/helicase
MVAGVTTGRTWPDGSKGCEPGNAIMLTAEDTLETTVKPRLIAAGADLERVFFLVCISINDKQHYFLLGEHLHALEKKINEIGNVALVTIDPITAYQGKINSSSATDVRGQLGPLKGLAERSNVAISTITHPPKRTEEHWISQFIGSQAYIAAARIGHVCVQEVRWDDEGSKVKVRKEEQRVFYVSTKGNLVRTTPKTLVYRRQEETIHGGIKTARIGWERSAIDLTIDEALAAAKPPLRTARIDNWLRRLLADGPLPQQEIVEAGARQGFGENQLTYARSRLGIGTHKQGLKEGWYWSLPEKAEHRNWKTLKM